MKENSDNTSHAFAELELNITDDEAIEFSDVMTVQPNRDHSDHARCYKCGKFQVLVMAVKDWSMSTVMPTLPVSDLQCESTAELELH